MASVHFAKEPSAVFCLHDICSSVANRVDVSITKLLFARIRSAHGNPLWPLWPVACPCRVREFPCLPALQSLHSLVIRATKNVTTPTVSMCMFLWWLAVKALGAVPPPSKHGTGRVSGTTHRSASRLLECGDEACLLQLSTCAFLGTVTSRLH